MIVIATITTAITRSWSLTATSTTVFSHTRKLLSLFIFWYTIELHGLQNRLVVTLVRHLSMLIALVRTNKSGLVT
ncbi:MAG: hypothetical protein PHR25_01210 [Clostridia bacterium]|nr:hypothetical protein [Clostridia bacterium]MDD4375385.1 hypothetical protein [Clostridia bacterium]